MKISLGFSPCPNDTFIFDALIHHKIDTEGLEFEVFFDDVETLNQKALNSTLDITKLSFHAFAHVADRYALLDAGSALGHGVGPMLICKNEDLINNPKLIAENSALRVGVPGELTTANFLLGIAYPNLTHKEVMVFSEIEDAVLDNKIDMGLIIHENRFTYMDKGLHKIVDLGTFWEELTGCAIPLGGIVVNRKLSRKLQHQVNRLVKKSVQYAFDNPLSSAHFVARHAQEMNEAVMYKHIALYVNKFSVNLGIEGRKAIDTLFEMAFEKGIIPTLPQNIYVTK